MENNELFEIKNNELIKSFDNSELVVIPDNIKKINNYAFQNNDTMVNVIIPNSVTKIGSSAFEDCTKLKKVILPNSVVSLGPSVFRGCKNLTEIRLSSNLKEIFPYTFYDCNHLKKIVIPKNIDSIGDEAFSKCSNLEDIEILNKDIIYIHPNAFFGCNKLNIENCVSCKSYISILNVLQSPLTEEIVDFQTKEFICRKCGAKRKLNEKELNKIIDILENANPKDLFEGTHFLASELLVNKIFKNLLILYPDNIRLKEILEVVNKRKKEEEKCSIKRNKIAFYDDIGLKVIRYSEIIKALKIWKEKYYKKDPEEEYIELLINIITKKDGEEPILEKLIIPEGITDIFGASSDLGLTLFQKLPIKKIIFPTTLEYISSPIAFEGSIIRNIWLPENLKRTGRFDDPRLTFKNCKYLKQAKLFCKMKELIDEMFINCSELREVYLPNTVEKIGKKCFANCTMLPRIFLSENLESIGDYAFKNCVSLRKIFIPESVKKIGKNIFDGCSPFLEIECSEKVYEQLKQEGYKFKTLVYN